MGTAPEVEDPDEVLEKIGEQLAPELKSDPAKQIRAELRDAMDCVKRALQMLEDLDGTPGT